MRDCRRPTSLNRQSHSTENYESSITRAYYFIAGGNIPLRNALYEVQPSMMVKTTFQMTQAELTLRLRYNRFIWGGLAYRWNEAIIFMAGCEFKNFLLGYSYDYSTSAIQKASSGTMKYLSLQHETRLSKGKKNKHKSIRYYKHVYETIHLIPRPRRHFERLRLIGKFQRRRTHRCGRYGPGANPLLTAWYS